MSDERPAVELMDLRDAYNALAAKVAELEEDARDADILLGAAWQRSVEVVTAQGKPLDEHDFNRQRVKELLFKVAELEAERDRLQTALSKLAGLWKDTQAQAEETQ